MISKMQGQTQRHSDSTHLPLQSDVFRYGRALVTARFLHHQGWKDFEEVQLCTCVCEGRGQGGAFVKDLSEEY